MDDQGRGNTSPDKREPLMVYVRKSVQAEIESHIGQGNMNCLLQHPETWRHLQRVPRGERWNFKWRFSVP